MENIQYPYIEFLNKIQFIDMPYRQGVYYQPGGNRYKPMLEILRVYILLNRSIEKTIDSSSSPLSYVENAI